MRLCGIHFRSKEKSLENQGFLQSVGGAGGVEPLSENLSAGLSTSLVGNLTFPPPRPCRQGHGFSSPLIPPGAEQARVGSPH